MSDWKYKVGGWERPKAGASEEATVIVNEILSTQKRVIGEVFIT